MRAVWGSFQRWSAACEGGARALVDLIGSARPRAPRPAAPAGRRRIAPLAATLAVIGIGLTPAVARASTGCDAINSGLLNFSMTVNGTTITSTAQGNAAATYRGNTVRNAAQTEDQMSGTSWVPNAAASYNFAADEIITLQATLSGYSGSGAVSARLFEGSGAAIVQRATTPLLTVNGAATPVSFTTSGGTLAVQSRAVRSGTLTGTISVSVSCAAAEAPPTLSGFSAAATYNSVGNTATNINVATGGNATNNPTGYTVSATSGGAYGASATTGGGGTVTINASGQAAYTPLQGYRGSDTFFVRATNGGGDSAPATVSVTVGDPTIAAALTGSDAKVGTPLSGYAVTPSGGRSPYSCSLSAGSALPTGVSLASNCALTGTPEVSGTFAFNVDVVDSSRTGANGTTPAPFTRSNVPVSNFVIGQDAPTVTAVAPTFGPTAGGTTVTITGSNFYGVSAVTFGATAAASFTRLSATSITAVSPNGSGTVNVLVTTAAGTSGASAASQFVYSNPPAAPAITVPANGATTSTTTPTYSGVSDANVTITVVVDNVSIGTTTASPSGTWSKAQPTPLGAGGHTVYAFATNAQTQNSANSATNSFTVSPTPVANNYVAPTVAYNPGGAAPSSFSIAGQASNNPTSYAVGSATTTNGGTVSIDSAGLVTYTAPAGFRGNDSFIYTASNAGGTSAPATVTVPVGNPTLTTTLVGSGTRGTPLSGVQISTSGGRPTYNCSTTLASGALPAGTALNPDCSITGTPAASGTFTFQASITDSSTGTGPFTQTSNQLTLTIAAPTLTLSPAAGALPGATAGAGYSQTFTASSGTAPYNYTLTAGALPPGLTLSGSTVSGTPVAVGTFNFAVTASDSSSAGSGGPYTRSQSYSIIVAPPVITLNPSTLPNGSIGAVYSASVTASGGTASYAYSVTAGALPPGLSINPASGALSGTPTAGGTFNFTVTASDSTTGPGAPYGGSRAYAVTIGAPTIALGALTPDTATIGASYSATLSASGGTPGYVYAVTSGALPAGVTLTGDTLSGTPTAAGVFTFDVTATDSSGGAGPYTGTRSYTLTVGAPTITLAPASLAGATAGVAYSQTVIASGGTPGYVYAVTAGSLPAGLTLTGDTITGTPSAGGTFNFTVTATDSSTGAGAPFSGSRAYALTVAAATVVINQTTLPNGAAGTPYSQTLTASGGNGTYGFAVTAGALPPGWTLSPAGVLSGTATAVGAFNFTITATDQSTGAGAPYSGSRAFSVTLNSPAFTLAAPTLAATVGQPYSGNFVAGGGTAPYAYSREAGTLPPGLTLAADGTLAGTPTASGTFNFTIVARDQTTGPGAPYGVGSGYTFTVAAASLSLSPATLPNGRVGTAYAQTVTASGGTAPYQYDISAGALPAGLTIDAGSGAISGTPSAGGTYNFTVRVRDSSGGAGPFTVTRAYALTIDAPTITVAPTTLPSATPGLAYSQTLTASGGTAPYTFTSTGALPAGITLSAAGVLSGTPTVAGTFTFTVIATDQSTGAGAPYSGSTSYTLTVGTPAITIDTTTVPNATVATAYSTTVSASGGTAPYIYAVTAGALPAGIAMASDGTLSGTPSAGGSFTFTVTATDSSGGSGPFSGSRALTLVVDAPTVTLSPAALPAADVGAAYSQVLTASGGTAGYSFAVTAGALPAGVTLASDGTLAGMPSAGGTFNFTVTAQDSSTGTGPYAGSRAYSLVVDAPVLALAPASLPSAAVGSAYNATVSASGGTAPYAFALTAGALPAGVTLASDGTLSGTPSAGGSFTFTVTVTDSSTGAGAPYSASRGYTLDVNAATLAISPAALPNGQMEVAYNQALSASGGTAPYSFTLTAGALPAGLSLAADGTIAGIPGVNGTFNFTVTATDSSGGSGPFSVSRAYSLVIAVPAAPVAGDVSASVAYGSSNNPIAAALSGGTATSVAIASPPAHGSVSVSGLGFSYTPATGYFGSDGFTYTATNDGGTSAPATVTVNVGNPPAPTVSDVTAPPVPYGSGGTAIDLSGSISGVRTSVAVATGPLHGTVTIAGDVATYTPNAGYYGSDSFTFTATGPSGTSAPATVSISVGLPAAPTAADRSGIAVPYQGSAAIDLSGAITGVHDSIAVTSGPAHGTTSVSGDVVTYTANAGYYGPDSFAYAATGPGGTSNTATVSVDVGVPPAPVAADVSNVAVPYNSTGTQIDLAGSITGVHTSVSIATNPSHGTVTVAGDVVTYIPASGYSGADAFTFTASGPGGTSNVATVTLQVAVPPAPIASDVSNVAVPFNGSGTAIDLSGSISGVRNSVSIATNPAHGTVSISGEVATYVPTNGYYGTDSFTFTATGPGGTSNAATVTLQVAVPPAPTVANRGNVAVAYNSAGTPIDLASDIGGVYTSLAVATNPAHGTVTLAGTVATYVPNANYYGADSFAYTATGPGGTSSTATVSLVVAPPPPPTAGSGSTSVAGSTTTTGMQSVTIDLSALATGSYDRIEIQAQPAHGTVTLSGNSVPDGTRPQVIATYSPALGFVGADSFTFVAVGPGGRSAVAAISITVVGRVPVAQPKTAAVGDGQTVSVMLTEGATEGPFTAATVVSATPANQVTTTIVVSGSGATRAFRLDVTAAARFSGTAVVTYTLTNVYGVSAPATVTVTVSARPDPTTDANVRAISDAQAEVARRFARTQVSNFMRRTEQLHNGGAGTGGNQMGVTLNARDGRGIVQAPGADAWALEITDRMRRSSEDPALGRLAASRKGLRWTGADTLGTTLATEALTREERNTARKASGLAGEVQPLIQDEDPGEDGTRRVGSIGLWTGGSVDIGTQDATTDRSKITATTAGLSAGADIKLADGVTVGVGGGYGNDFSRIDGGAASVRSDSSLVAVYASLAPVKNAFVDAMVGRGDLSFRTRRLVADTGVRANGSRDGTFTVGALALGVDRQSGALNWSLYGRGEVLDAKLSSYVEDGAGRYNLRFDERGLTSVTGTLGARFELKQRIEDMTVLPRLRLEWSHEFADADAQRLDYADIPGSALYGIDTRGWGREQFQLSLGSRFVLPSLWSFDFETAFRGSSGQRSGTLRVQATKEF